MHAQTVPADAILLKPQLLKEGRDQMILTKKRLSEWLGSNYIYSQLTSAQCQYLLAIFGKEPAHEPPYIWDEETI